MGFSNAPGNEQFAEALSIALTTAAVARGFGKPASYLSTDDIEVIGVTTFIVFVVGLWASSFARISVACLLLQITQHKTWKLVLRFTIASQVVMLVACDIAQLVQCRPIRAIWAPGPDSKCISPDAIWTMAYAFIGIGMVSDAVFAVLPALIIWKLSRSRVEKVLLTFLMGFGLFAMAAGVFKIITVKLFDPSSPNVVGDMMPSYLWTRIEEILLIIAACAPLLKSPIENLLHRGFGIPRFVPRTRALSSVQTPRLSSTEAKYYEWHQSSQPSAEDETGAPPLASRSLNTTT